MLSSHEELSTHQKQFFHITVNFAKLKINKLQKLFSIWPQRDQFLYGRILIAKPKINLLSRLRSNTSTGVSQQISC